MDSPDIATPCTHDSACVNDQFSGCHSDRNPAGINNRQFVEAMMTKTVRLQFGDNLKVVTNYLSANYSSAIFIILLTPCPEPRPHRRQWAVTCPVLQWVAPAAQERGKQKCVNRRVSH